MRMKINIILFAFLLFLLSCSYNQKGSIDSKEIVEVSIDSSYTSSCNHSLKAKLFSIFRKDTSCISITTSDGQSSRDNSRTSFFEVYFWTTLSLLCLALIGFTIHKKKNAFVCFFNKLSQKSISKTAPANKVFYHPYTKNDEKHIEAPSQNAMATEDETCSETSIENFSFAHDGFWNIIGASVIGKGHISSGLPCQDNCAYKDLGEGWGIAILSDGAGSAEHSDIGSKVIVQRGIEHFEMLINTKGWRDMVALPTDADWLSSAYQTLKLINYDLALIAKTNNVDVHSLNATIIVVVHTPTGLLTTHIGDGRCGYRDISGNWISIIEPHKGEEANQTIFLQSDFWDIPNYVMSGVLVPESKVIRGEISGFMLMSDGCESTAWLCNQFNEDKGAFYDPNEPYAKFFNPIYETLCSMHKMNTASDDRQKAWVKFLNSNGKFSKEQDDKTLIVGILNI